MFAHILEWIYTGAVVLLLFNITIFIHELGHFWVGRWRGAKIERFAVWFGPPIWKRMINGVEWRLGCIPLGGYVAFPQLAMEAIEGKSETPAEELTPLLPKDKIPILFAGSFMNLILGFVIATIVWVVGEPRGSDYYDLKIGYIKADSPEWNAGVRSGDVIKTINGVKVTNWDEIFTDVALNTKKELDLGVETAGQYHVVSFVPDRNPRFGIRMLSLDPVRGVYAGNMKPDSPGAIAGIKPGDRFVEVNGETIFSGQHLVDIVSKRADQPTTIVLERNNEKITVQATPKLDANLNIGRLEVPLDWKDDEKTITIHQKPMTQIKKSMLLMYESINALIHKKTTGVGVKDFSGPVGIVHQMAKQVQMDIRLALAFLVMLNINLAIVNLLPIPVLDGGHIVFSIIEAIRRRPLNQKFLESTQMVFVALIITFVVYVSFNDIRRIFEWEGLSRRGRISQSQAAPPQNSNSTNPTPTQTK